MTASASSGSFQVRLLGPFQVQRDGVTLDPARCSRRSQRLLTLLVIAPERRRFRNDLLHLLWPDATHRKAGMTSLRVAVHELRRWLGELEPSPVLVKRGWLLLNPAYRWEVDLERFETLLGAAGEDIPTLEEALELVAGEPLPEEHDQVWAQPICEQVNRRWYEGCLQVARLLRVQGHSEAAVIWLQRLLERRPLDEEAVRQLIEILHAVGRHSDGLHVYERFAAQLSKAAGGRPEPATQALVERLQAERQQDPGSLEIPSPLPRPPRLQEEPPSAHSNLPRPAPSFVGRERDVLALCSLLRRSAIRLVTLTGPGGIGKTRLALEVAHCLRQEFPDGVYFVSLASLGDPDLVLPTIARALGVCDVGARTVAEALTAHLGDRKLLVLLDTFGHVLPAAPQLGRLLAACPRLTLLVTSRAVLHLSEEHDYVVPPLAVPPAQLADVEALARYDAVALFLERARAAKPDFLLTDADASAVGEICRRLEGLPLAIELAAARIPLVSLEVMLCHLERRLEVLTTPDRDVPPRHRSLRAAIDWSYDQLDGDEQVVFRRLAIFQHSCTVRAAEAVCDMGDDPRLTVLNAMVSLVDKSLLHMDAGQLYTMLDTIQEYALERLAASGEAQAVARRHAAYFLELAEAAAPELRQSEQALWLERLERDHDNIRVALRWCLTTEESEWALRIAAALSMFWIMHGHVSEGRRWMEEALQRLSGASALVRSKALSGASGLAYYQGAYEQARAFLEESLAPRRELGDKSGIAAGLNNLGALATEQGNYEEARAMFDESLGLWRELDDHLGIAVALTNLGFVATHQGDYEQASVLLEESLPLRRELGDTYGLATTLNNLGHVALHKGEHERARALCEESLALRREIGDTPGIAATLTNLGVLTVEQEEYERARALYEESLSLRHDLADRHGMVESLEGLAAVMGFQGSGEQAARLFGAAEALREMVGAPLPPTDRPVYKRHVDAARAYLDHDTWTEAWQEGRVMTVEQAIDHALAGHEP